MDNGWLAWMVVISVLIVGALLQAYRRRAQRLDRSREKRDEDRSRRD